MIKWLYKFKIKWLFYFGLGWNELSAPIVVVRDIGLILAFLKLLFGINLSWKVDIGLCVTVFIGFTALGIILKKTGMSDYMTEINNSVNPQLKKLDLIAKKLNI